MKKRIVLIVMCLFAAILNLHAQKLTGRDLAQKVKDRPDGDTRCFEMVMKLVNKRGSIRERRLKSYSIDVGKGGRDRKSIMFFEYPADVKGTGFLTWDYDEQGKDDDKWLYLPAMKKTRRISGSSAKHDYFMGSDFTYDDMGSRNVDEDTHTLLAEEMLDGKKCWVLESVSKDSRDIYSKKKSWIRQDCLVVVMVEYYDKMENLHRKLALSEVNKIDGFWLSQRLEMENVQTGHKTIIEIKNPKFNIPISEGVFNVTVLEKGGL